MRFMQKPELLLRWFLRSPRPLCNGTPKSFHNCVGPPRYTHVFVQLPSPRAIWAPTFFEAGMVKAHTSHQRSQEIDLSLLWRIIPVLYPTERVDF